eukprot:CAMPEP_0170181072 /NCGR_PEP_ID=MMETSP0040_2-20121228/23866_1 /TAXON_ID=641309 /ORGANISM="Lotharella oceanica, Strain CCMP622" /LENGTH=40 /DNA_ID= /DNA_START= /DNA_END= /DNA_ORIENTATION=
MVCGTKVPVRCMGGYVGGTRVVAKEDLKRWPQYMPSYIIE